MCRSWDSHSNVAIPHSLYCLGFVSLAVQIVDLWPPLVCETITRGLQQMHRRTSIIKTCMFSVKSWIMRLLNHPREIQKGDNGPLSGHLGSSEGRDRVVGSTKEN